MMNNPADILKVMGLWNRFKSNHPKFPKFLQAVANGAVKEGTIIEIRLTQPDGEEIASNLKVTADDMELFRSLKENSGK